MRTDARGTRTSSPDDVRSVVPPRAGSVRVRASGSDDVERRCVGVRQSGMGIRVVELPSRSGEPLVGAMRRLAMRSAILGSVAATSLLAGCTTGATHAAKIATSPSTDQRVALGAPLPETCAPVRTAVDLIGLAHESGAVVEGSPTGATSTMFDAQAAAFHVTAVLRAAAGVTPAATIELLFGPPGAFTLPPGRYLLFLVYNAVSNVYTITEGDEGTYILTGTSAVSRCPTEPSPLGTGLASNAAVASSPLTPGTLEGLVGQLNMGQSVTN